MFRTLHDMKWPEEQNNFLLIIVESTRRQKKYKQQSTDLASRLEAFEGVCIQSDPRGTFRHPSHRPPEFTGHQPPGNRGQPRKNWLPLMSSSVCKKRGKAATACVQVSCCRHCLSAGETGSSLRVIRLSSFSTQAQKHSEHYILWRTKLGVSTEIVT